MFINKYCSIELLVSHILTCMRWHVTRNAPSTGRGRKGGRKGRRQPTMLDRYSSSLADYTESEDVDVTCDAGGLVCDNSMQRPGRRCEDYATRFLCACGTLLGLFMLYLLIYYITSVCIIYFMIPRHLYTPSDYEILIILIMLTKIRFFE